MTGILRRLQSNAWVVSIISAVLTVVAVIGYFISLGLVLFVGCAIVAALITWLAFWLGSGDARAEIAALQHTRRLACSSCGYRVATDRLLEACPRCGVVQA